MAEYFVCSRCEDISLDLEISSAEHGSDNDWDEDAEDTIELREQVSHDHDTQSAQVLASDMSEILEYLHTLDYVEWAVHSIK